MQSGGPSAFHYLINFTLPCFFFFFSLLGIYNAVLTFLGGQIHFRLAAYFRCFVWTLGWNVNVNFCFFFFLFYSILKVSACNQLCKRVYVYILIKLMSPFERWYSFKNKFVVWICLTIYSPIELFTIFFKF